MQRQQQSDIVLWMEECDPQRVVPNTVMMAARGMSLLVNLRDITPGEYRRIIRGSGSAGIMRL